MTKWILAWALAVAPAAAQVDRATLVGTVTDPTGAATPNASVEAVSQETGLLRKARTNGAGEYSVPSLPIGAYTVTVSLAGFKTVTIKEVRLGVGDTRALDVQLEVGALEERVSVEAVASSLESETSTFGAVIDSRQMREIPLNGRHWASLMALAPGAINTGAGDMEGIRFNGRSNDDNNWTLDGIDFTGVKDPTQEADLRLITSTDTVAEFRVNSTLYSAESGSGGGAQINLVTKSGTNDFHGSVFEFFRNDKLDARNPFDKEKNPFRLNQFGGNFGGPIVKNRTFFFANYEGMRQRVTETRRSDVPSAAFRAQATNPAIQPILNAYPAGNQRTTQADIDRYEANRSTAWNENSGTLRVDHRFNDNNTIFGRFNTDDGVVDRPQSALEADRQTSFLRPTNVVLQYQRIFTPTVINESKAGFNRAALNRIDYGPFRETINISGFQSLNDSNHAVETGTNYSLIDNLSFMRARHTVKVGGEIRRSHVNVADPLNPAISVTYPNRTAFLNNAVDSVSYGGGNAVLGTRKWSYYAYIQDDFKVSSTLTLNLGLRYEYYGVNSEAHDRYRVFDMYECRGFCPHGTPWYFADRNNFDPRAGIAWAPRTFKGKTVIRAGAGIYHGPGQIDDVNAALDNYADNYSLTRNEAPDLSFPVAPFLGLARNVGLTPRSLQRDRRDLYASNWGFAIQQELPAGFITQVGYVGSVGKKLFARVDINRLDPVTRTRFLPNFGRIDEKRQDGNSNFNGLQISLQRRAARGLMWTTEYMWSHSINDFSTGAGEGDRPQNSSCRACDRGSGALDVRHTFTSNWVYQLPFGPGQKYLNSGAVSKILGGWDVSGIWAMRTGRALNITMSRSSSDLPDGNSRNPRPNLVPGVSIYPEGGSTFDHWLNPAAFANPASRTWGNLGRHVARGPGAAQVDVALQKRTKLTERTELVFRTEAFNLFNRVQAGNPGTVLTSPASFGLITSGLNRTIGTGTSRQIQFAMRLNF